LKSLTSQKVSALAALAATIMGWTTNRLMLPRGAPHVNQHVSAMNA
jgi:hypothetical protein